MAIGVPENDVFAAADSVLARGERPTVERVRLELGAAARRGLVDCSINGGRDWPKG
jgi:hypothetical protein